MFEPFHSHKIDILQDWNYRQYLRPDDGDAKYLIPAKRILSGDIRDAWIDKYNSCIYSNTRLIKDIRTQLLLGWIFRNFPRVRIVMLMRHPCAVVHSKLALRWDTHLDDILMQEDLVEDFLQPFLADIQLAHSDFEKHIFMWCIENYVPLRQLTSRQVYLVFYEDLVTNPLQVAENLFKYIGGSMKAIAAHNFSRPSAMSRDDSAISRGGNPLDVWQQHLGEDQVQRALEILQLFNLDQLYGRDKAPLVDSDLAFDLF